jgi:hypothetical protein
MNASWKYTHFHADKAWRRNNATALGRGWLRGFVRVLSLPAPGIAANNRSPPPIELCAVVLKTPAPSPILFVG